jgi:hypothetical protein
MSVLSTIWDELVGLFVEDGFLAIAIVALVLVATLASLFFQAPGYLLGTFVLGGSVIVLLTSLIREVKRR